MAFLIDTNLIIRFLAGDHREHLRIATEIFSKIERGEMEAEILHGVLMEALFVMVKFYRLPKREVIDDLKRILLLRGITGEKALLVETLNIMEAESIDFVDALICGKSRFQNYGVLSFDEDLSRKC
jgi:predicted nucleic-acid-binding protein